MKILAVKNGGFLLSNNYKNIGNYECQSIIKLIEQAGNSVVVATAENYKTLDVKSFDKLICFNSTPFNFYGGGVATYNTYAYELMAKYDKTIFYIELDVHLPFVQLWDKLKRYKTDLTKDDVWVNNPIVVISQNYDIEFVLNEHKKHNIYPSVVEEVRLNEWIYSIKDIVQNKGMVDLILGANYADAYRKKKYFDYVINQTDISREIYGKLYENEKVSLFSTNNKLHYSKQLTDCRYVVEKNACGMSTIIVGSAEWQGNMTTLRVAEAFLADCVTFIDNDFDPKHKISDESYIYVSSGNELKDKILEVKSNSELKKSLLDTQHSMIDECRKHPMINDLVGVLERYV